MSRTIDPKAIRWIPSRGFPDGNRWECWRGLVYLGRVFQARAERHWWASRVPSGDDKPGAERRFDSVEAAAAFTAGPR